MAQLTNDKHKEYVRYCSAGWPTRYGRLGLATK
jgi:hypothetical protein